MVGTGGGNVGAKSITPPIPSYTLKEHVLSYSENVKGWVSFKSFTEMQYGISLANNYYTFDKGNLFLHYDEQEDRNTFYGTFSPSTFDVILNDDPGSVKVFNTLNYEGSQAKVNKFKSKDIDGTIYNDQEYYNLYKKEGWSVESIVTNKETGSIKEFVEKDGEWFNGISKDIDISAVQDAGDFTFQGIGIVGEYSIGSDQVKGCTDPLADNYNDAASVDDGSCSYPDSTVCSGKATFVLNNNVGVSYGVALGSNAAWKMTIVLPGGNTNLSRGLGGYATISGVNDGTVDYSSVYPYPFLKSIIEGSGGTLPYTLTANFEYIQKDKSVLQQCSQTLSVVIPNIPIAPVKILGCTDPTATNFDPKATTDDGSCLYKAGGCTDPDANNYNPSATFDDGSCVYGDEEVDGEKVDSEKINEILIDSKNKYK